MRSGVNLRAVCTVVHDTMFEAHRGAIPSEGGRAVLVFGNDGYSTPKTQRAIQIVRARLARDGYRLGDPVADAHGYTWVMEAEVPDRLTLEQALAGCQAAVWDGWTQAAIEATPDKADLIREVYGYQRAVVERVSREAGEM